jgi:hypothetical protein
MRDHRKFATTPRPIAALHIDRINRIGLGFEGGVDRLICVDTPHMPSARKMNATAPRTSGEDLNRPTIFGVTRDVELNVTNSFRRRVIHR